MSEIVNRSIGLGWPTLVAPNSWEKGRRRRRKGSLLEITIGRHMADLASEIESSLNEHISKFIFYSITLDKSKDMTDTIIIL